MFLKRDMKKKKKPFVDDGHTVYDMSGLYPEKNRADKIEKENLSRKEKFAAFKAAMVVYGPILLGIMLCFGAAMLLISLWLG